MEQLENQIFEIITHAGTARANLYEALEATREGDTDKSAALMKEADSEMTLAHNVQTELITADLQGETKISLLLIHAQDQLMTTMSEQTLIQQMIKMQEELNALR
ncbi:PTS lactose/cellobiose transporter subunit IIA [Lacticaseibacillus absianus]|uniref:PTS lactose/cellobiose transporter subunit IIA n=1 Tax=Lacticaseibacillus absianus TaxID=2729623 RepID=UPI0015CB8A3D|nr:PTS lactose/cellobiose transporter subunit IIA [Lacticaseibacillus absianus]